MSPREAVRRGPRPVGDRLRRLLVILPWLSWSVAALHPRRDGGAVQLSETELVRDLEQAAMCGLPPYLDEVIDLYIDDDGTVNLGVPRWSTAPLRLTAPEGFALLAAGRLAMSLPGADPDGPLGRALAKLQAVLGDDAIVVDVPQPPATADLAAATAGGEQVEITYWSASSDATTTRTIVPRLVFTDRGEWYVRADDDRSGEERHFRIDRIAAWRRTGERGPSHLLGPRADGWLVRRRSGRGDRDAAPRIRHRVGGGPCSRPLARRGGRWFDVCGVRGRPLCWLADLLVRIGPAATVVSPAEWVDLGQRRAAELLTVCDGETG